MANERHRLRYALVLSVVVVVLGAAALVSFREVEWKPPQSTSEGETSKPNIVLIIVDTLRADRIGAYGFGGGTSPELDGYARNGVRFARVIASSSWTRPSIGSLLTSLHPRTLGIYEEKWDALDDRFVTLPEVLQDHGYTTIGATANPNINASFNFDQGFTSYVDSTVVFRWMPVTPGAQSHADSRLRSSREIFQALLEKIERAPRPPYYVQAVVMEVHEARARGSIRLLNKFRFWGHQNRRYLQAVRQVAHDIDWFVRRLCALPGWGDTLFVITSDHGQGLSDHPSVAESSGHGRLLYESQVLVPLILYSTAGKLPAGREVSGQVRLLDLAPTLIDYADLPRVPSMAGVSLLPLLDNDEPNRFQEHVVVETNFRGANKIGVYTGSWKYFENRDGHNGLNRRELHRVGIVEDGRRTDIAAQETEVVEELAAYLAGWERQHPKAERTATKNAISEAEVELLRSLGYVQ